MPRLRSPALTVWFAIACGTSTPEPAPPAAEPPGAPAPATASEPAPPPERQCRNDLDTHCFVRVPGGSFLRGAQSADPELPGYDPDAQPDEGPPALITLAPFWIGRDEVGVSAFQACVHAGACQAGDATIGGYSNLGSSRNDHPINGVTWEGARRACAHLGGRLPTEAEWEYAARGSDGRRWPWGNDAGCGVALDRHSPEAKDQDPGADLTMRRTTCATDGTFPNNDTRGRSPWGLRAMAGSVWEWVEDRHGPYPGGPQTDPRGPATGEARVIRGGGWTSLAPAELRATARAAMAPDEQVSDVGFRCVWGTR